MPSYYRRRYRRSRRAARLRNLRRWGSSLKRGLDVTVQPGTVRDFNHMMLFNGSDYNIGSQMCRINGLGKVAVLEDFSLGADYRYVQCCALYSEFRILSMNVEIIMNGVGGTNFSQTPGVTQFSNVEDLSRMFIMATVNRTTTRTTPGWDYNTMKNAPGTIISRSRTALGYPRLNITVFPTTLQERTSWIRTHINTAGVNQQYAAGMVIPFSPTVDFILVCPGGVNQNWLDPSTHNLLCAVTVICRYRLMFRNAGGVNATQTKGMYLEEELALNEVEATDATAHIKLPAFESTNATKKEKNVTFDDDLYPSHDEAVAIQESEGHVVGTDMDDGTVVDGGGEHFVQPVSSRTARFRDTLRNIAPAAGAAAASAAMAVVAAQAERQKNRVKII